MSPMHDFTGNGASSRPTVITGGSKPINATLARRISTLVRVFISERRSQPSKGRVLVLSRRLCVKYGDRVDLSEASTMQFIAANTSIPAPKIKCAFTWRNTTYIVMEHIDGTMIAQGWTQRTEDSKAKILSQLKGFVHEMRQLPPPPGQNIMNVDGGSLFDPRIPVATWRFGPFTSTQGFHEFLHNGITPSEALPSEVNELIVKHGRPFLAAPVFTHGDLSSLNILAKGDRIIGIVDWESAGWFPSYWEYTTANQVNPQNPFWAEEIDKFLDTHPEEEAMEKLRQKYFGIV